MTVAISLLSTLGAGGILLFFIKRYFDRRDAQEVSKNKEQEALMKEVKTSLETIRLLAYARMSEEIERDVFELQGSWLEWRHGCAAEKGICPTH